MPTTQPIARRPVQRRLIDSSVGEAIPRVRQLLGDALCRSVDIAQSAPLIDDPTGGLVIFIGIRQRHGTEPARFANQIKLRYPNVSIYVVTGTLPEFPGALHGLAKLGVDDIFVLSHPHEEARLAETVRKRFAAPAPERALARAQEVLPSGDGRTTALWILRNSFATPGIDDAARLFHCDRKTVRLQLQRAQHPDFSALRRLGLYLHALELRAPFGFTNSQSAKRLDLRDSRVLTRAELETELHRFNTQLYTLSDLYEVGLSPETT